MQGMRACTGIDWPRYSVVDSRSGASVSCPSNFLISDLPYAEYVVCGENKVPWLLPSTEETLSGTVTRSLTSCCQRASWGVEERLWRHNIHAGRLATTKNLPIVQQIVRCDNSRKGTLFCFHRTRTATKSLASNVKDMSTPYAEATE